MLQRRIEERIEQTREQHQAEERLQTAHVEEIAAFIKHR